MHGAILDVKGLRVMFRSREGKQARAVDGVHLSVGRGRDHRLGRRVGLRQDHLARTMLGLERPYEGTIEYDGQSIFSLAGGMKGFRRKVQFVFQDPSGGSVGTPGL